MFLDGLNWSILLHRNIRFTECGNRLSHTGGERNWVQVVCNGGVASLMSWLYIMDCGCGEQPIDLIFNYRCSWLSLAVLGKL